MPPDDDPPISSSSSSSSSFPRYSPFLEHKSKNLQQKKKKQGEKYIVVVVVVLFVFARFRIANVVVCASGLVVVNKELGLKGEQVAARNADAGESLAGLDRSLLLLTEVLCLNVLFFLRVCFFFPVF